MEPTVSPIELLKVMLDQELDRDIVPAGIVIGPATDAQQQAGVISMVDAGLPKVEKYVPIVWARPQFRCIAPDLQAAERIARHTYGLFWDNGRTVVEGSDGRSYLVHHTSVTGGPSAHYDSPETWEYLMFGEAMIGLDPVP